MIIADTSAWIDYFNGIDAKHTNVLDRELSRNRIGTGDLILAELLQGFRSEKDYQEAKSLMESLDYFDLVGKEIALLAGQNFRLLRREGITVRKTIDVLIATFCIVNDFELIHNDRDFEPFEEKLGLRIRKE
jgi:predicted nucleic acid-binding protein